jgi:hypothetical protein
LEKKKEGSWLERRLKSAFDEVSAIRGLIKPRWGRAKPKTPPAAKSKADFESRFSRLTAKYHVYLLYFLFQ